VASYPTLSRIASWASERLQAVLWLRQKHIDVLPDKSFGSNFHPLLSHNGNGKRRSPEGSY